MEGYLRSAGIPVNIVAPDLSSGGLLSRVQPIQFGGSAPVQIHALSQWQVPTPKQYLPEGLSSAFGSIASGIEARTKRKQEEADKKAEREFKATEAKKEREAKLEHYKLDAQTKSEISEARERIKGASATKQGAADADDFFSASMGGIGKIGEPESTESSDGEEDSEKLESTNGTDGSADGEPYIPDPEDNKPHSGPGADPRLLLIPSPSTRQNKVSSRRTGSGDLSQTSVGTPVEIPVPSAAPSAAPSDVQRVTVVGPLERSLILASSVPKAVPVDSEGKPNIVSQQSGLLQDAKPLEEKQVPHGRGEMGEPNLRAESTSGPLKYPMTFRDMNQYNRIKRFMDTSPEYGKTLSGKPKYDPKTGLLIDVNYVDKSEIEAKKLESIQKQKDKESKFATESREHAEKISLQEGRSIMSHPAFKNFEGLGGYRPMTKIFISAYDVVKKNPKVAGISDMELIDTYVRAATGGKPTEAQFHSAERGKSWGEILGLTLIDKPMSGAKLSQGQRDQMLRTMLENYNTSAEIANDMFDTARQKMIKAGQTDEIHHPKDYVVDLMLKSDAENKLIENSRTLKSLQESKKEAIRNNDKEESDLIDNQIAELASESNSISKRLKKEKYSGSQILGIKDFKHKKQGYVGGAGGFIDFGALQAPALQAPSEQPPAQVNIVPDNR